MTDPSLRTLIARECQRIYLATRRTEADYLADADRILALLPEPARDGLTSKTYTRCTRCGIEPEPGTDSHGGPLCGYCECDNRNERNRARLASQPAPVPGPVLPEGWRCGQTSGGSWFVRQSSKVSSLWLDPEDIRAGGVAAVEYALVQIREAGRG